MLNRIVFAIFAASLSSTAAQAAEVGADYFGAEATLQTFATVGGTGFYAGGAVTADGIEYAGSPVTQIGPYNACRSNRCVANSLDLQTLRVTLGTPVSAAGAYVSGSSNSWAVRADFFDSADSLLGSITRIGSGSSPLFVGFESTAGAIARVNFVDQTSDLRIITIDDFVTQTSAAVPEPSAWAMLIAGFGLAGAAARRRHTVGRQRLA